MRYRPFNTGEHVIAIVDYDGVSMGTVGKIMSKLGGTAYVVRLPDGTFRWLSDRSLVSTDPRRSFTLAHGDIGLVVSDRYQNFAKEGDTLPVYKVVQYVDYYKVLFDGSPHWFGGFQLARYGPHSRS